MISRQDLKGLLSGEASNGDRVLSLYLLVDQGRAVNLNRGFEAAFKSLSQSFERGLDETERKNFQETIRRAGAFLADYQPSGKSLVYFTDREGQLDWSRSFDVSVQNQIHWARRPFVRPLLEARDEFQRYGVVLTDRAHARLFTVFLGEIEEKQSAFAEAEVRKFDASGRDQLRSQMHFQRKADEHARWHLKNVAELLEKLAVSERFDRLVLGGPHEVASELKGVLSDRLRRSVIGLVHLPVDAGSSQILSATLDLLERVEREGESSLVEELMTQASKNHQAVVGLEHTLQALREGRIRTLVYSGSIGTGGGECGECRKLFGEHAQCPYCFGTLRKVDDLLEAVAVEVFREGGDIEHVKGEASTMLVDGGGIGAFLRF